MSNVLLKQGHILPSLFNLAWT